MIFTEMTKGVWLIEPEVHRDNRGYVYESYRADEFEKHGLNTDFETEEVGQLKPGKIELGDKGYVVSLSAGKAKVLVYGHEIEISGENKKQVYVEKGMKCSLEIFNNARVLIKQRKE